jgi:branched-chain amino acid transport system permease protein
LPAWLPRAIGYGLVAILVFSIPQFVHGFRIVEFTYVGVYTAAIVGLVILTGITGQISLGQSGFMVIGGYTTMILSVEHGWPQLATIPVAGLIAGIAGFLFGFPALRLSGVYLALATFSLGVIVPSVAVAFSSFTGGTGGILSTGIRSPTDSLSDNEWLYYVTWACVAILYILAFVFLAGKRGRALRAIRENELAATASGVSLARYKTLAFGVAAAYAGVAGSLFAILQFGVTPGTFLFTLSILLLAGLVIGGPGSLIGAIIGAAFVQYIQSYSGDVLGPVVNFAQAIGVPVDDVDKTTPGVPSVVYGVILLLVLFLLPNGAAGLGARIASLTKRVL